MTLDEALHYIHSVCWKGSVPGLERISALLDKMGHPERKLKFIHVTGTNGKGSTCAMLASMFTKAGYKTGLYTSPYLIRFNERIQINGVQIPDEEICEITEYIKPLADSIFEQPTEFEMVTALGFEYFARHNCDLVVCEVGMGGEFDATNVILPPETAIICNIGLDHTEVLGDTLEKIAATKSGIIKPGCDAVIYREAPSVEAVIEARCKEVGAKLHKADFADIHLISHDLTGQVFDWERFHALKLPLLGNHQLHNAAVALTAATVMQQRGWKLTDEQIREGLATVRWPGRFDVRRSDPLFIIDGRLFAVDDSVAAGFDDAGLRRGDLFQRVAKHLGVVEADVADDGGFRRQNDVRRVKFAAHADLAHDKVAALSGEVFKAQRRDHFKLGRLLEDGVGQGLDVLGDPADLFIRDLDTVDLNALVEADEVGAGIKSGLVSGLCEHVCQHGAGRTLSVRAGHVDEFQLALRVSHLVQKRADALETRDAALPADRMDIIQCFIKRHGFRLPFYL